jgi:riboflavin synthase
MFTGIIETVGSVISVSPAANGLQLSISAPGINFHNIKIGDSIAVNGVCLTATRISESASIFSADASHETVSITNIKYLKTGSPVHIERALAASERFDGHIVTGHVDAMGTIQDITSSGDSTDYHIAAPKNLLKYIAKKGSIAVDGVSLTVNDVNDEGIFRLTIIPHTASVTNISNWYIGYEPNLEVDILARYVERMNQFMKTPEKVQTEGLTEKTLIENGFI